MATGLTVRAEEATSEKAATISNHAQSQAIESIDYDEAARVLILSFKRGTYRYEDVPAEVVEGLKKSESQGAYFKENIRGKFKTSKVEKD